jgi:spore maturation protein CgeB
VERILYIGTVWPGSTTLARRDALAALGHAVTSFDTTPYLQRAPWLARQLGYRLSRGPALRQLNAELRACAAGLDGRGWLVWVDKGLWLYPETLAWLRERLGATLVHYTPDPQLVFQPWKLGHFVAAIPGYDVLFTTKPFEVDAYRQRGAHTLHLVHQSYDDQRIGPRALTAEQRGRLGAEVSFIGQYTPHYARLLQVAVGTGARTRLWGPNWRRRLWRLPALRGCFAGDGVWGDDYVLALNAADIALCFLSKRYPETTTTRTFEIPGCGTFMLAERTDAHRALFEEDREAAFFGSDAELADKVRHYLRHPDERRRIAAAGLARSRRSGYGDRARMAALLTKARAAGPVG